MQLTLPIESLFILHTLQTNGYTGYIVGGAVRDSILNMHDAAVSVTDFDFTTDATPEQITSLFAESYYENDFGTVSITHQHIREQMGFITQETDNNSVPSENQIEVSAATKLHPSLRFSVSKTDITASLPPYEITTFRTDGEYTNFRRPVTVAWGKTLEEDLERRDFTVNAMAVRVDSEVLTNVFSGDVTDVPELIRLENHQFEIIDPHHGQADLEQQLIRTVGDPQERFNEDALRMLRAIRFSVQLGFAIEQQTWTAIVENAELLMHISGERIRDEFFKMLISPAPKKAIDMLDQSGLLSAFLPELLACKGVEQSGHHTTDVWTHSLDALAECPSTDPIVRLATLLHDIAKPVTAGKGDYNTVTFYNHEVIGARMGKTIAERLKLSKKDIDRIFKMIRFHMFHYQPEHTDAAIRRFMRRVGLENLNDILDLREADRLGSGARKTSWRLEEMKQRMNEQLHQPFDLSDLAINGNDFVETLHLKPGPQFGEILQQLLEDVLENPEHNTKEYLLEKAKSLINQTSN